MIIEYYNYFQALAATNLLLLQEENRIANTFYVEHTELMNA